MKRTAQVALVLALVVAAAGGAWWLIRTSASARSAPRSPIATPHHPEPTVAPPPPSKCARAPTHPFEPRHIQVAGLARSWSVIAPPRDSAGIPGVPPLTSAGKLVFAWDREQGVRPGDRRGNVLLNAHTWPDGSALGNRLLTALHRGDRIVVQGRGSILCYRVTRRVEVAAAKGFADFYDRRGRPQLAIVVCSGRRLGPGQWLNRTIWFASPSRSAGA